MIQNRLRLDDVNRGTFQHHERNLFLIETAVAECHGGREVVQRFTEDGVNIQCLGAGLPLEVELL